MKTSRAGRKEALSKTADCEGKGQNYVLKQTKRKYSRTVQRKIL